MRAATNHHPPVTLVVSSFSVKWNRTLDKLDMAKKPGEEA
jgi:hypothetical protein